MTELELAQLRNIRSLICQKEESTTYISYQRVAKMPRVILQIKLDLIFQ